MRRERLERRTSEPGPRGREQIGDLRTNRWESSVGRLVWLLVLFAFAGCVGRKSPSPKLTPVVAARPQTQPPPPQPPPAGPIESSEPAPEEAPILEAESPREAPDWDDLPEWVSLSAWNDQQQWGTLRRVSRPNAPSVFEFSMPSGRFDFASGSRTALWNGLKLDLGFPPRSSKGDLGIHALDLAKNLAPLRAGLSGALEEARVVVLDPGHGGRSPGARSLAPGGLEKDYALDWALRLERLLSQEGWVVRLTRRNDATMSLEDRVAFAEAADADLFISLHFNAVGSPSRAGQAGIETYCLTPAGMPSTIDRGYEDDPGRTFPNNAFDAENLALAAAVHGSLIALSGSEDRGIRRARFMTVLRGQRRPAVLIEGGFLTHAEEARRIADPDYRQTLAEAVARALPTVDAAKRASRRTDDSAGVAGLPSRPVPGLQ